MHEERKEIVRLAEAYVKALEGGHVLSALRLHAEKAEINLKFVVVTDHEPPISSVYRVLQTAAAQGKLDILRLVLAEDGIHLPFSSDLPEDDTQFPYLHISEHASYLPTSHSGIDPEFCLLRGQIINRTPSVQRVLLRVSLGGFSDVVATSLDAPPGESAIPRLRKPRLNQAEAAELKQTVCLATLNVELHLPGVKGPVDYHQLDIWLSQPDIVLSVRLGKDGQYVDYTHVLAWWVNSGAPGIADFLASALPLDIRKNLGYSIYSSGGTESLESLVDDQVRTLYHVLQKQLFTFLPTELVWIAGPTEIIQRIRKPEEILSDPNRRINCVDATILFASLLEYMGIDPVIVLVPRHVLVGWKRYPHVVLDTTDYNQVWQNCGFLDTVGLSSDVTFDVAASAAEGYLYSARKWFGRTSGPLTEFASIIDVKAARGTMSSKATNP